jgi:cytochrome c
MYRALSSIFACFLLFSSPVLADDRASMDEAKAMAERAANYLKSNGLEQAAQAFNDPANNQFRDRDLYVFVFERNGTSRVFPPAPATVNRDARALKDVDGKQFIVEFTKVKEPSWVDYKWKNAQSGKVEQKSSYVIPVDGQQGKEYVVGVGAYKPN